jgi:hypothetical protein
MVSIIKILTSCYWRKGAGHEKIKWRYPLSFVLLVIFLSSIVLGFDNNDPAWNQIITAPDVSQEIQPSEPRQVVYRSSMIKSSVVWENSPDIAVTTDPNTTQSENSVFIDPNNSLILLNSNNSSDWPVTTIYGNAAWISTDGGQTWSGDIYGPVPETRGDPATAIDHYERMYVGNITEGPWGQGIAWSDDLGANWTHVQIATGYILDKNHLWIDNSLASPYENNLYSAWTNMVGGSPAFYDIELCLSTDRGINWSTPAVISDEISDYLQQGVNIQTGPDGQVYATWATYPSWPSDEHALGFAKSLDGGQSWLPAHHIITDIRGHRYTALGGGKTMRHNSFPSMTVDQQTGQIFVTWTNIGIPGVNTGDPDIYMISSLDEGTSWSTPVRVNQDAIGNGLDQYFPWIACDQVTGNLVCIFYDSRNFPGNDMVETYVAVSLDNGATWEDFMVSDAAWSGDGIVGFGGNYAGDYLGIDIQEGKVYPMWSDDRTGNMLAYISPFDITPPVPKTIWVDGTYGDDITGDGSLDSPYLTITKGISEALDDDTIQVRPGLYRENLDYDGKALIVNGQYGAAMTILEPDDSLISAVKMTGGEGPGTRFSGFTVRKFSAHHTIDLRNASSPAVENNIFTANKGNATGQVLTSSVIRIDNSNPTVMRNLFFANKLPNCVFIQSGSAKIINNTFNKNYAGLHAQTEGIAFNNIVTHHEHHGFSGRWPYGFLDYNDVWSNNPNYLFILPGPHDISVDPHYIKLEQDWYHLAHGSPCIDMGNPDPGFNDPDGTRNDMGAFHAMYVLEYGALTIQATIDRGNGSDIIVYPGSYSENLDFHGFDSKLMTRGGPDSTKLVADDPYDAAVKMETGENETAMFSGFTVTGCRALFTFRVAGEALPLIRHNIFADNKGDIGARSSGVIRTMDNTAPIIMRNLFVGNDEMSCVWNMGRRAEIVNNTCDLNYRGLTSILGGRAKNNIVTNSDRYGVYGLWDELDYNDVWRNRPDYENAIPGPHSISADPMYNPDYTLRDGSPCIDAGDPGLRYLDPDGTRNDMGAYPVFQIGGFPKELPAVPFVFSLSQNYPNPFNPSTEIYFTLPEAGHADLTIYNILGQRVRSLVSSDLEAGRYSAFWDGTDNNGRKVASGIYIYRLQTGGYTSSKKMLLLK